jgi:hypothetical protein
VSGQKQIGRSLTSGSNNLALPNYYNTNPQKRKAEQREAERQTKIKTENNKNRQIRAGRKLLSAG